MTASSALIAPDGESGYKKENPKLAEDERWQLVHRIASSQHFAKAAQLREILLYITRRKLLDQAINIREYEIACEVLGRRDDFDPSGDNIVRVQIGHLRKKLEQYFSLEGKSEPLVVTIPKGTYVPSFEPREAAAPPPVMEVSEELPPDKESSEPPERPFLPRLRWAYLFAAAGVAAIAFLFYTLGQHSRVSASIARPTHNPILDRIFISDVPVSIVVADTNLVFLQNMLHTDLSLKEYISRNYPANILANASDDGEKQMLERLAPRRFTSLADLNIAVQCVELAHQYGAQITIRYARYLNARDFEKGNFILIGSRTADPWVTLFEPRLNFAFEEDPATHIFHFRNKHPLAGEQDIYIPSLEFDPTESYVDIAILPNLTKTGYVLLLNAASMEANEAATQLIFNKELRSSILKAIGPDFAAGTQSVEIFLRDRAIEGVVSGFEVIAVRRIPA